MTTDKTGAQATVSDVPEAQRYQITTDEQVAGFTAYRDRDHDQASERIFFHTEIDDAFGGRGLATILITEALNDTREQGKVIVGVCPLVAAFLEKHPEFAADSRAVTPEVLSWLRPRID